MNLINVLQNLRQQIINMEHEKDKEVKKLSNKYDKQIKDLETAYDINFKMNTICIECEGKGVIRYNDGYYSDTQNCSRCHGTGREPKEVTNDYHFTI